MDPPSQYFINILKYLDPSEKSKLTWGPTRSRLGLEARARAIGLGLGYIVIGP